MSTSTPTPGSTPAPAVEPHDAQRLFSGGALALDVREPDEYAAGHVAEARLLPLGQVGARLGDLPRNRTIVVVCRSGRRSAEATRLLLGAGFADVHNLTGGMIAWRQAGLPVAE